MTGKEFAQGLAAELSLAPLDDGTVDELLDLAATAAHSSERLAAPLACYLAGLTGKPVAEVHEAARRVADA